MARMRLKDLIAGECAGNFAGQRLQGLDHARFPVDQRAVAIEGQGFEVGEFH